MEVVIALSLVTLFLLGGYKVMRSWEKDANDTFYGQQKRLKSNLDHYRTKDHTSSATTSSLEKRGETQLPVKPDSYEIQEDGTILRTPREEPDSESLASFPDAVQQSISNLHPLRAQEYEVQRRTQDAVHAKISALADSIRKKNEREGDSSLPLAIHVESNEEFIKQPNSGEELSFSKSCTLLEAGVNGEVYREICHNHLSNSNNPPIDILRNYSSERGSAFIRLTHLLVEMAISGEEENLDCMRDVILFSHNADALYCVADMQQGDLTRIDHNMEAFEELKKLAHDRYSYLTLRKRM